MRCVAPRMRKDGERMPDGNGILLRQRIGMYTLVGGDLGHFLRIWLLIMRDKACDVNCRPNTLDPANQNCDFAASILPGTDFPADRESGVLICGGIARSMLVNGLFKVG